MNFSGFHTESFQYFANLTKNNHEDWFKENEETYERHILTPCRELVAELGPVLSKLNPILSVSENPDDHISRLEMGNDRPPEAAAYKTSIHVFFWNTEINRLTDATFYVSLNAEGVVLGFSIYNFGVNRKARLLQVFRPRIRTDLGLLDDFIKSNYLRRGFHFHRYAKAPGRLGLRQVDGFPARATEWEDTLGWVVSRQIHTESSRLTPGSFVNECSETFERLYPLYLFASDPRPDWRRAFKKFI